MVNYRHNHLETSVITKLHEILDCDGLYTCPSSEWRYQGFSASSRKSASRFHLVQGKHAKLQRVLSCLSDVHTILVALTESHVFVLSTPDSSCCSFLFVGGCANADISPSAPAADSLQSTGLCCFGLCHRLYCPASYSPRDEMEVRRSDSATPMREVLSRPFPARL
jgi:hypothetical protein